MMLSKGIYAIGRIDYGLLQRKLETYRVRFLTLIKIVGVAIAIDVAAHLLPGFAMTAFANGQAPIAPARDPDIAVQEEFESARMSGTVAAWRLFIARHPDHRLAEDAREELRRLTGE